MAEDELADNLDGYAGSRCKGCRLPTQVVWAKVDAYQLSSFHHDHPRCLVRNGKNSILGFFAYLMSIITKSFSYLLRYEDDFLLLATLRPFKDQFLILKVFQPERQHLTDPHSTAGHQFEQ
jgi:hypothetical protein